MISVVDVFHHIAQDLRAYSGVDQVAAVEEFLTGSVFDFDIVITKDVEDTELGFLNQYGKGHSFFFKLEDYDQGRHLAKEMYWVLLGETPDLNTYKGDQFVQGDKLYLFVHLRNVEPLPAGFHIKSTL